MGLVLGHGKSELGGQQHVAPESVSRLQKMYSRMDAGAVHQALNTTLEAIDRGYSASFVGDQQPNRQAYELEKAVKRLKTALGGERR